MAAVNLKRLDEGAYRWVYQRLEAAMHWEKPAHLQWRYDDDGAFQVFTGRQVIEDRPKHLMGILDHDYDDPNFLQTFWLDSFFQDLCNRYYELCGEEKFTSMAGYFYKQALKQRKSIDRSSIYTRHVPDWGHTLILSMKCETMMCIVPEEHAKSFCIASAHHEDNVITLSHL
tara:strand:- start:3717 stop:4232 length:516 start_codon:yes stop_codon:yes gene_type:complete